ncbi:MAG: DUF2075 domain-containing protein [Campylobacter sp.]|nr:DUF2075 domain-containing protein [Campylobacter sp.]
MSIKFSEKYFKNKNLNIEIVEIKDIFRYKIYKIRIKNKENYEKLKEEISFLRRDFEVMFEEISDEVMIFYLYLAQDENSRKVLGKTEFEADLSKNDKKYEIAVYCGRDMENKPYFLNLVDCGHIFIAGVPGSGKTVLLNNFIISIAKLNSNIEFIFIEPEYRYDFEIYENLVNLSEISNKKVVKEPQITHEIIKKILQEMKNRYKIFDKNGVKKNSELTKPFANIVVMIDEDNGNLFYENSALYNENSQKSLEILAEKGAAAGIFIIFSSLAGALRGYSLNLMKHFPTRIAMLTATSKESRLIIGENGAENLRGKGIMYLKMNDKKTMLFAPFLGYDKEIKEIFS